MECLEHSPDCKGKVTNTTTDGIKYWPRCEFHEELRQDLEQRIRERYPYNQPSNFDPDYAGERWDDEY
jgi:hypothetical protein